MSRRIAPRRMNLRRLWGWLHRWVGLSAGLLAALLGLSGAALVLKGPLLRWELGTMLEAPETGGRSPPDAWVTAALAAHRGPGTVMSVAAPHAGPIPAASALLFLSEPVPGGGVRHPMIAVDPGGGPDRPRVLGAVIFEDTWFSLLLGFHRSLLAGQPGGTAVALCGLLLALSLGSGLLLWWPRGGPGRAAGKSGWRQALLPSWRSSPAGRLRALHGAAGLWLLAPLAVLALSGTLLARPDWLPLRAVSKPADPATTPGRTAPEPSVCAGPPDLPQAIRTAIAAHPGRVFRSAGAGPGPDAPFLIAFGDGLVLVDRRCGMARAATAADGPPAQAMRRLLGGLHADLMLGTAGQALVFAAGLALPLFYVTGLWVWLRGRRNRQAGRTRRAAVEGARHG